MNTIYESKVSFGNKFYGNKSDDYLGNSSIVTTRFGTTFGNGFGNSSSAPISLGNKSIRNTGAENKSMKYSELGNANVDSKTFGKSSSKNKSNENLSNLHQILTKSFLTIDKSLKDSNWNRKPWRRLNNDEYLEEGIHTPSINHAQEAHVTHEDDQRMNSFQEDISSSQYQNISNTFSSTLKSFELDSTATDVISNYVNSNKPYFVLVSNDSHLGVFMRGKLDPSYKGDKELNTHNKTKKNDKIIQFSNDVATHKENIIEKTKITDSELEYPTFSYPYKISHRIQFTILPLFDESTTNTILESNSIYFLNLYYKVLPPRPNIHPKSVRNILIPLRRINEPSIDIQQMIKVGEKSLDKVLSRFSHKSLTFESKYHYSLKVIEKRRELLSCKDISHLIHIIWDKISTNNLYIDKSTYFYFWKCCYDILIREILNNHIPNEMNIHIDEVDELDIIESDFNFDSKNSQNGVTIERFYLSLFELADNWVFSTDKTHYTQFFQKLFESIFNSKRGMGGIQDIKTNLITIQKRIKKLQKQTSTKKDTMGKIFGSSTLTKLKTLPRLESIKSQIYLNKLDINVENKKKLEEKRIEEKKLEEKKLEENKMKQLKINEIKFGDLNTNEDDSARISVREEKDIDQEFQTHLDLLRKLSGVPVSISKNINDTNSIETTEIAETTNDKDDIEVKTESKTSSSSNINNLELSQTIESIEYNKISEDNNITSHSSSVKDNLTTNLQENNLNVSLDSFPSNIDKEFSNTLEVSNDLVIDLAIDKTKEFQSLNESDLLNNESFPFYILSKNGQNVNYSRIDPLKEYLSECRTINNESYKGTLIIGSKNRQERMKNLMSSKLPPIQSKKGLNNNVDITFIESPNCLREFENVNPFSKQSSSFIAQSLKKKSLEELKKLHDLNRKENQDKTGKTFDLVLQSKKIIDMKYLNNSFLDSKRELLKRDYSNIAKNNRALLNFGNHTIYTNKNKIFTPLS